MPRKSDRARWNAKYLARGPSVGEPHPFVVQTVPSMPGRALDLAGGAGRHALYVASQGWETTLLDVSDVGLAHARQHASEMGISLTTVQRDLERYGVPEGAWNLVVCVHYSFGTRLSHLPSLVAPGGHLVFVQATTTNLERHERPSRKYLVAPGTARRVLGSGLRVLIDDEGWDATDRHESRLLLHRDNQ